MNRAVPAEAVTLPADDASQPIDYSLRPEQPVKILLVDDHPENLVALESVLESLGQILVKAGSGTEALKHILDEEFAVILLDVQMPGMDGFETASMIRSREKTRHIPIIFLTAISTSDFNVASGYSVGAVDYIVKPFDPQALKAKVSAFVELSKKTNRLREEITRRIKAEEEVRALNEELERRVAERTAALEAANKDLENEVAERKRAEAGLRKHQAEIEALNARLQRAMLETHHRVKNNLQVIAAMIDMQILEGEHSIPIEDIRQLGTQVRTLAVVHDILTREAKEDGQANALSTGPLLEELLPMLQEMAEGRTIHFDITAVRLPARQGTSLVLLVNELVNNAIKHGQGEIAVRLASDEKTAVLEVRDQGPGFPSDFDPHQAAHMGLELVENLSRLDLSGQVQYDNEPDGGACVTVTIPIPANDSC
ncbi:MAG TPA: response regulator [Chthonomonadaceae bacterium]|nr:response regulator [Chthonomonadaceae bacterium]